MPWNVVIQGKHHTDIRKLSRYQSTISDALKCCHSRQISHWYQEAIWISVHFSDALKCCHSRQISHWYQEAIWISVHYLWCFEMLSFKANIRLISGSYLDISTLFWCLEMLPFKANITLISGSYLDISPLSPMPWNVAIQGKYHTDIRKLSRYQSTVSDALKCCHSWQTSYWYQEAIWISVHYLWCLEMLSFKANFILISGSYLDISPLSLMPWNFVIQGKHHTDIRKLSGYQSTISDALKCCHSRQTSYWYQEAIWISVHYLWCLEMLSFKANITLISGSYLDISPLSLMPWNVVIQGKHYTDIRKLSGYQSTVSDALKCCHSRQISHWYQEAI